MKKLYYSQLKQNQINTLCKRKAIDFLKINAIVKEIIEDVKENGDEAVRRYNKKFDQVDVEKIAVSAGEFKNAIASIPANLQKAFTQAKKNIEKFHKAQIFKGKKVEVMPGVNCYAEARPIEKVGLYVPGGTAPLPSTLLMLGIPAKLAGCREIVVCTPANKSGKIPEVILFVASLLGVRKIYKVGGAQAIAAMAYGTKTIPKVSKIFGPGNQYVTAAKMLVSIDQPGTAIDIPAGPSEILVIADKKANVSFVASDLLSQAEHGVDSQAVLLCNDNNKTDQILQEVGQQLDSLPRKDIATKALENSFAIVVNGFEQAGEFINQYAPEHLIINTKKPEKLAKSVVNAGSVFLGQYSCESAGDYASGTNHTLPTYGYAKMYSGVSVASFQKVITFQKISRKALCKLGPIVETMADQEKLFAHKRAIEIRYKK